METLEKLLAASEKTIAALMMHTYNVLNKEFKMVESRLKRTSDCQTLIAEHCKEKRGATDNLDSKLVNLNVGGKILIIKRSTILSEGDDMNFLFLMISGRWDYLLPKDRDGVIFVDLDPALIAPIFDKLRFRSNYGSKEQLRPRISVNKIVTFDAVVSYFRISGMIHGKMALSEDSTIQHMNDPKNKLLLHSFLPSDFTESRLRFELLYRGSRDGKMAADFHRRCDGKGNTVSVIKDRYDNVFGGFADKAWGTQPSWVKSEKSFLFSLKSSLGDEVVKFPVDTRDQHSLYHQTNYMCAFGNGDLHVLPSPGNSSISIGTSYQNPTSAYSLQYCTGGRPTFKIAEIEVYQVIKEDFKVQSPVGFNADDLPDILKSFTRTEQSSLEAVSESIEISNVYTTQTRHLSSNLIYRAQVAQLAEEELLLELMWIEHLSVPMSKRNISTGLLAEWLGICKASADVLPVSNRVDVTSCASGMQNRVEKLMAGLQIPMVSKMKRDGTEDSTVSSAVSNESESAISGKIATAVDDVISFNVGGTIIAVLRSTLLLQAPNSTFAARYSDRWVQQPDEVDKFGNIYMVKENILHLDIISSSVKSLLLFFLPSSFISSFIHFFHKNDFFI